jgi:hypothetical protein
VLVRIPERFFLSKGWLAFAFSWLLEVIGFQRKVGLSKRHSGQTLTFDIFWNPTIEIPTGKDE